MSLEQALLTHAEALNNYAAALRETAGSAPKVESKTEAKTEAKTDAAEKKAAPAATAEKKAAPAAEKKASTKKAAEKPAEIDDGQITAVFGPLLAKTLDEDQLASNKQFVATINEHFGVTKLRELDQAQRVTAIEWGKARAEDGEFEIPSEEGDDDAGI